jgi:NAD(P)H-nitrite reductase large subunit
MKTALGSSEMDSKYLIIGNSVAAVAAVEAIRETDESGSIIVVSREPKHVYSRPLISYWLAGKVDDRRMDWRPRSFYDELKVKAVLGVEAVRLDPAKHTVELADGSRLGYEKLLIATGGVPIVPGIAGRDAAGVFTFTEWADAERVRDFLAQRKVARAVVVGAGMIGVKAVEALVERGLKVTVVELAPRVLATALDEPAARLAQGAMVAAGVEVRCGAEVEAVVARERHAAAVRLKGGEELPCELVVLAVGVAPNAALGRSTAGAVEVDRGILVDDLMRTSAPDVYAAGDAAQGREALSGAKRAVPIWPGAYRQGRIAGQVMAGAEPERYDGALVMNSVSVFGLATISVGVAAQPPADAEVLVSERAEPPTYRKVVLKGGRIIGAMLVGDIDRAGIFTGLIRSKTDVSAVKALLLTEQFGVLSLPAEYRKHVVSGAGIEV